MTIAAHHWCSQAIKDKPPNTNLVVVVADLVVCRDKIDFDQNDATIQKRQNANPNTSIEPPKTTETAPDAHLMLILTILRRMNVFASSVGVDIGSSGATWCEKLSRFHAPRA